MWTLKGLVDVHILLVLHVDSRRAWISSCTAKPDAAWVQQVRNFVADAE